MGGVRDLVLAAVAAAYAGDLLRRRDLLASATPASSPPDPVETAAMRRTSGRRWHAWPATGTRSRPARRRPGSGRPVGLPCSAP